MDDAHGPAVDPVEHDAVVLAGGRARRLGGVDKPGLDLGGTTLLDRVLAAVPDARTVVCVGPARPTTRPVLWCREQPPGGGPVAALTAALPATSAAIVVVLAADLPAVGPAVPVLIDALRADDGAVAAVLVDATGWPNHLAAAWRRDALAAALADLGDPSGAAVRALVSGRRVCTVADPSGWGRDCDTWDDVDAARGRL